jgi:hypothetical protein
MADTMGKAASARFPATGLLLLFLWCLVPPIESRGEIYQWTDEAGVLHFTDEPAKAPPVGRGPNRATVRRDVPPESDLAWFQPKPPPSESGAGDVSLRVGGRRVGLAGIHVRRFVGRIARDLPRGMTEWWVDGALAPDFRAERGTFPRVTAMLVDAQGRPVPVYREESGRVVRSAGGAGEGDGIPCTVARGDQLPGMYGFMGYSREATGMGDIGKGFEPERIGELFAICFLGCTPAEAAPAGVRFRADGTSTTPVWMAPK